MNIWQIIGLFVYLFVAFTWLYIAVDANRGTFKNSELKGFQNLVPVLVFCILLVASLVWPLTIIYGLYKRFVNG